MLYRTDACSMVVWAWLHCAVILPAHLTPMYNHVALVRCILSFWIPSYCWGVACVQCIWCVWCGVCMNTTVCAFYISCSVNFCSAAGSSWSRWACGSWEGQERCKGTAFRCTLYTRHLCRRIYSCKWNRDIIIWYFYGRFQGVFWSSYTTYEKHWPALCLWKPNSIICSCMHLSIKSECRWYVHLLAPLVYWTKVCAYVDINYPCMSAG